MIAWGRSRTDSWGLRGTGATMSNKAKMSPLAKQKYPLVAGAGNQSRRFAPPSLRSGPPGDSLPAPAGEHLWPEACFRPPVREAGVTAGHENLFLTLAEQRSDGGNSITEAVGRSLNVTAQKTFIDEGDKPDRNGACRPVSRRQSDHTPWQISAGGRWSRRFFRRFRDGPCPRGMSFRTKAEVTDDENYTLSTDSRLTF